MKFQHLQKTRDNILRLFSSHSIEELNKIPLGFNNNLYWNYAHVIVTSHLITYGNCDLEIKLDDSFVNEFRKGSKPFKEYTQKDADELIQLSNNSLNQIKTDYENGLFANFKLYETSFGVTLENIDTALEFLPVHEGLHLGYMMALRKSL